MKTLNEEIAAIKAANMSKNAKKNALVKLGITNYEISIILDADDNITPAAGRFTFGVEMECFVARGSIRLAAERTGMAYEYEGYNHNDGHSYFKFVTDGSLIGDNPIECVSPILKGFTGKLELQNALRTLNEAGASVNRSCGLHVHIGAAHLTAKQYANVFANYYHLEPIIDKFMARSRRANNNRYCHTLRNHANLTQCEDVESVLSELNRDRYHKVNPMAYLSHKTIEFRQHQGSTDAKKILNWIAFCGKLVNWSKKNRLTSDIESIDEIPFLTQSEKKFFKSRMAELNQ